MPTVQGTDDFNHAINSGAYDAFFGAPVQVLTPIYQSQPATLKIPSAGTNVGVRKNITGSPTKGWMGWALRFETIPTGAGVVCGELRDAGGTVTRFVVESSGELHCYVSGGVVRSYGVIAADTWYWVEAIFDVNDGTGIKKCYWRVNGVDQTTASDTVAASTLSWSQLLSLDGNGTADWYVGLWKWGSAASVTDWLGEPSGPTLDSCLPDADITTTGWTTTPLFSKVNDASDATVIQATAS